MADDAPATTSKQGEITADAGAALGNRDGTVVGK